MFIYHVKSNTLKYSPDWRVECTREQSHTRIARMTDERSIMPLKLSLSQWVLSPLGPVGAWGGPPDRRPAGCERQKRESGV